MFVCCQSCCIVLNIDPLLLNMLIYCWICININHGFVQELYILSYWYRDRFLLQLLINFTQKSTQILLQFFYMWKFLLFLLHHLLSNEYILKFMWLLFSLYVTCFFQFCVLRPNHAFIVTLFRNANYRPKGMKICSVRNRPKCVKIFYFRNRPKV